MNAPDLPTILAAELVAKNLSVYRLAKDSRLPLATVQRIVSGEVANPGLLTMLAILAPLGRDLRWLHAEGFRPSKRPEKISGNIPE